MSNFPNSFDELTKPLEPEALDAKGAEFIRQLAEKGFEVHLGLTLEYADQIAAMCLEPAIKEYCPRDYGERFVNRETTAKWLTKRRGSFLLLKREAGGLTLAGYGWAGDGTDVHAPGGDATFAVRVGQPGHGQGLATPFSWLIVAASAALYGAKNFWLETWASNGAAVHIYHKLGFEDVAQEDSERPTGSGEKVPDTRLYMTLANELLPATT